jgi:hypothetical protein
MAHECNGYAFRHVTFVLVILSGVACDESLQSRSNPRPDMGAGFFMPIRHKPTQTARRCGNVLLRWPSWASCFMTYSEHDLARTTCPTVRAFSR